MTRSLSPELSRLAQQLGVSQDILEYCLEAELIQPTPSERDVAELRRIRRLQALEVNLAGIEIILRMRRRIITLRAEIETITREASPPPEDEY